jgi:hypothetical protein
MNRIRVASPFDVGKMAEQFLHGVTTLRREEAIALTPRATIHGADRGLADDHTRGLISATSMLTLTLHEATGDVLDRGIARDITRRVVAAYLDQIGLGGVR